jgi:hypothetical protein
MDRKAKNKLGEQLAEVDKIVYSVENIKYLDSGRKIAVEGLINNNRFLITKDREKN